MTDSFVWKHDGNVLYGIFPMLNSDQITHGLSTRMGGVSTGCFTSMNLAYNSDDNQETVKINYQIFASALKVNLENAVLSHQTHQTNILKVTADDKGKGFARPRDYESIDGMITNEADIPLMTFHADCVPLVFFDPINNAIGLAHAGWKGTAYNLAGKMVEAMKQSFGTDPEDLLVGIGPSIRECCFIIRDDVRQVFLKELPYTDRHIRFVSKNQWQLSLQNINTENLMRAGVKKSQVVDARICTCCRSNLLFSHRAQGTNRGTMAALIQINKNDKKAVF